MNGDGEEKISSKAKIDVERFTIIKEAFLLDVKMSLS